MNYVVVGLGNPGEEYANTRHNVGKLALDVLAKAMDASEWNENKKMKLSSAEAKVGKHSVKLLFPLTMMNNSGKAVAPFIKSKKDFERLVVIYDDLDLPLGRFKMSYGRSSGGHRGLESIIKTLKSRDFVRIRVGVSPETAGGKLKKPTGEKPVIDFILGKFKPAEQDILKKEFKKIAEAVEVFVNEGKEIMMNRFN